MTIYLPAAYEPRSNWPAIAINPANQILANKLKLLFASMPELSQLYQQPNYQDAACG